MKESLSILLNDKLHLYLCLKHLQACPLPILTSMEEFDELLGSGTEEVIYKKTFKEGYDEGSLEGSKEGWQAGLNTGTDIGLELGKYKGFALAVQEHLQASKSGAAGGGSSDKAVHDNAHAKTLRLCEKVIKLVDEFSLENVTSIHDATSQIRTQYNLLKTFLGVSNESHSESVPGQKYSF